ncbi:MAG: large conductance mechanosensitive channel protein MscL [Chloroflexota bacterium]
MWKEFREFINKGNVIDLAVGVVIATAFTAIVTSLTDDIIMPLIGALLGGIDFSSLSIQIGDATIAYGNFIQAIINFLIIAFVLFLMVRGYNRMQEKLVTEAEEEAAEAEPPADVQLLTEIRDLLKEQGK